MHACCIGHKHPDARHIEQEPCIAISGFKCATKLPTSLQRPPSKLPGTKACCCSLVTHADNGLVLPTHMHEELASHWAAQAQALQRCTTAPLLLLSSKEAVQAANHAALQAARAARRQELQAAGLAQRERLQAEAAARREKLQVTKLEKQLAQGPASVRAPSWKRQVSHPLHRLCVCVCRVNGWWGYWGRRRGGG